MERTLYSLLAAVLMFSLAVLGSNSCGHCLAAPADQDEALSGPALGPPAEGPALTPGSNNTHGGDAQDKASLLWTAPPADANPVRPDEPVRPAPVPDTIPPPPPVTPRVNPPAPPASLPERRPPAVLPPELAAPIKLKPINPAKAGVYTSGIWRFEMKITSPGTRTEGRWGWLTYDGQKLPRGDVNDYYDTPWGPIYWVDVPTTPWGVHGWMPVPLAQNPHKGRPLAVPKALLAAAPAPPTTGTRAAQLPPPAVAAAPVPRPQTLEINKTHNGQLAKLRVGNILVIRLPGNPATGYQWQAATTNSPALKLTVRPQYSPAASATAQAAASGTYTFTFQAVQPGNGSIRLYYVRANDPSHPRDSFAVGVNVSPASTAALPPASRRE